MSDTDPDPDLGKVLVFAKHVPFLFLPYLLYVQEVVTHFI